MRIGTHFLARNSPDSSLTWTDITIGMEVEVFEFWSLDRNPFPNVLLVL